MEEGKSYFNSVMASPSDDGQYTDTDKEEDVNKSDKSSRSGSEGPSARLLASPLSGSWGRITDEERSDSGKAQQERMLSSSETDSGGEDEEVRLRRKLLEKHNAAEVRRDTSDERRRLTPRTDGSLLKPTKEPSLPVPPKKDEHRRRVISVSDDEEMFSMQPKEAIPRPRSFVSRGHEERSRDDRIRGHERVQLERNRADHARESREDRHHRHHDRNHDRHERELGQGDSYARRPEMREDRSRHGSSRNLVKDFSRTEFRAVATERTRDDRTKGRSGRHNDDRDDRPSTSKAIRRERSRSPRKREATALSRRSSSREPPAAKKIHIGRREILKQEISRTKDSSTLKKEKIGEEIVMEIDIQGETAITVKTNHQSVVEHDDISTSEHEEKQGDGEDISFKYSKFDSSPEHDDGDEEDADVVEDVISEEDDLELESDSTPLLRDSEDEVDDIMNYDEEVLLKFSPERRARIEAEQQAYLISQLPVYYPGVSGCRSVAEFECLNRIEEGTFGVVYRAKEKRTDEIVALKRLKMEKEKEGFPITSLREINMLLKAGSHPNIVNVREVVVGSNMDKIYLVMEYIEHDLKSLMDYMHARQKRFTLGQVKTLMHQLLEGVRHMHDEWILHRDLKTSNLLLSHRGILKIGDFGLAREFGDPLKPYTPVVVTLWYRSPELLLGIKEYSTEIDLWSCGCIFGEFLRLKPLFPGKGEIDQINKIFLELGTPNDTIWEGYSDLPGPRRMRFERHEHNQLRKRFPSNVLDESGFDLLNRGLLVYDPKKRITAEKALRHRWFREEPHPTPPEMFPTWPAKSELCKAVNRSPVNKPVISPKQAHDEKLYRELKVEPPRKEPTGFALKFDAPKFK